MWVIAINGKEPVAAQVTLDELNHHQTPRVKYKVNISLFRRKSYQRTDLEDIHSVFDQVVPVVSHIEVRLPKKPLTPKNIGEVLNGPRRQFLKKDLFVQYDKSKYFSLLLATIPIKYLPEGQKYSVHSLLLALRKVTVLVHINLLNATV